MQQITEIEVKRRLSFDNPWWDGASGIDPKLRQMPRRAYFDAFCEMALNRTLRRAVVLMGPRRVGKTVMLHQTVLHLLDNNVPSRSILYVSLDTPTYTGLGLDRLLTYFRETCGGRQSEPAYVFFDEVQYLRDWERHLKSLVDSYPAIKFVVSGSAAAALRLKSDESGAGRFSDFMLPPLTFAEFLHFRGQEIPEDITKVDVAALNTEFINYLNFGGFPEAIFSETVRASLQRHIGGDIIDKVLLRDLPSLYGIQDTQELNRLFATLAYNTGNEVSLIDLTQSSGVAKNTLGRYIEYLEAAFLIRRVHRIDENARHFRRATNFKVYLTNPSLRAALFGPIDGDDQAAGRMAETALISQLFHHADRRELFYARWKGGEVDIVLLDPATQRPDGIIEVKWSDRAADLPSELAALQEFVRRHPTPSLPIVCTRTTHRVAMSGGVKIHFVPVSFAAYGLGQRTSAAAATHQAKVSSRSYSPQ
jgi:predicted AAA+ superfamily ATPase